MTESNHDPAAGPFDSQDEARSLPSVRITYDLAHGGPPGTIRLRNAKVLTDALVAAGVSELGAYDRQVLTWQAGWEPQQLAVLCSWLTRAHAAGAGDHGLADDDTATVLDALEFAAEYRRYRTTVTCEPCGLAADGVCCSHKADLERAKEYDELAERIRQAQS